MDLGGALSRKAGVWGLAVWDDRFLACVLHFFLCSLFMDVSVIHDFGRDYSRHRSREGGKSKDLKLEFKPKFQSKAASSVAHHLTSWSLHDRHVRSGENHTELIGS